MFEKETNSKCCLKFRSVYNDTIEIQHLKKTLKERIAVCLLEQHLSHEERVLRVGFRVSEEPRKFELIEEGSHPFLART
jgi:hypothetical protein